ncbi:MAG: hypothetical protein ABMA26_06515 [Limisphaerales bacterium]
MDAPIRYVADLSHVREVSLRGTADLGFWTARLGEENLAPVERSGRAEVLIIAAEMTYMGIRFTEVSISLPVTVPGQGTRAAAFLVHAFNSCQFFAFCERRLFKTPYSHADCHVSATGGASVRISLRGETVFRAAMAPGSAESSREPVRSGDDGWEGPVLLPRDRLGSAGDGRLFFGRIKGHTLAYPFERVRDEVAISPSKDTEVLQSLLDSGFAGEEWLVRADASHGKSKTYRRMDVF